jgi:hypothetical protein
MILTEKFRENFPFISCVKCKEKEHVCIIQNHDDKIMTFYDFGKIKADNELKDLLSLGEIWWHESNRRLPINIFIGTDIKRFRYCLTTITMKDVELMFGPMTSMNDLLTKRIKRRQIQLIRKPD